MQTSNRRTVAAVSDCRINVLEDGRSLVRYLSVPDRLTRLDVVYQPSPIYFVTACAANRRALLANQEIHSAFRAFADCAPNCGAWVGAYVLMPAHLRLFVAIDGERLSLSAWMKSLKGTLSSKLRAQGNAPPYWQKDFLITRFAAATPTRKNGIMCVKNLSEQIW
jgi:REP element-mobilizing transposase RayT